jgi:hypothetical protein
MQNHKSPKLIFHVEREVYRQKIIKNGYKVGMGLKPRGQTRREKGICMFARIFRSIYFPLKQPLDIRETKQNYQKSKTTLGQVAKGNDVIHESL